MANVLNTPGDWQDYDGASPPSYWDGTRYVMVGGAGGNYLRMTYAGSPGAEDRIQATIDTDAFDGDAYLNYVSAADEVLYSQQVTGAQITVDIAAVAGRFVVAGSPSGTDPTTVYNGSLSALPWADVVSFNCACDDDYPTRTLAQMREFLMIRLGWAAMKDTPLPGVADTLNAFLQDAQDQLHAEYRLPRLERFFTWDLIEGQRFYDLDANADVCTKRLDPRQLTWVGVSDGNNAWRPLVCGIPPESYYGDVTSIPTRYEIRQCIELWPPPSDTAFKLRVKGYFYNMALEADDDICTLDYVAVQLFALANAKAHYGQADAANVMRQAMRYVGNMTAGAHGTRRYVPGATVWVAPPLPVLTGYPGDP